VTFAAVTKLNLLKTMKYTVNRMAIGRMFGIVQNATLVSVVIRELIRRLAEWRINKRDAFDQKHTPLLIQFGRMGYYHALTLMTGLPIS
jgi:hypothetical protein